MRFRVALILMVLAAASCGGSDESDDKGEAPPTAAAETTEAEMVTTSMSDEPSAAQTAPWGLDNIVMPDKPEAVEAVLAALPGEIGGMSRNNVPGRFDGALGVEYGDGALTIRATPMESVSTQIGTELTALEWVETMAGGMEGDVEGAALEANAPLAWIASAEEADNETAYLAVWCNPDGLWYFDVVAASPERRFELIQNFIAAAAQM